MSYLLDNIVTWVTLYSSQSILSKVVECHGHLRSFRCVGSGCGRKRGLELLRGDLEEGKVPYCSKCGIEMSYLILYKIKWYYILLSIYTGEPLKPEITFFGEQLPTNFRRYFDTDTANCDLVLVVGTSLKVGGSVHELLKQVGYFMLSL